MLLTNVVLLLLIVFSFFKIDIVMEVSVATLSSFTNTLFPSMFFSLVLCKLLIQNGFIKQLSKYFPFLSYSTFVYGILSALLGFAGGTLLLKDAYERNEISKRDVECVSCCFCIPSFSFFITIGTLLNQPTLGIFLFGVQCIFSFFMLCFLPSTKCVLGNQKATLHSIKDAIQSSSYGLYIMLGYILLISISLRLMTLYFPLPLQISIQYLGEFASSCLHIIHSDIVLTKQLILLAFVLGFGSFSAHLQVYALLPIRPSYLYYFAYRIGQSIFSASITLLYCLIFLN